MQYKIDWLSITVPDVDINKQELEQLFGQQFYSGGGRAPYSFSLRTKNNGITVFYGANVLIELSGIGCSMVGIELLHDLLQYNVTRIDLAIDLELPLSVLTDDTTYSGHYKSETGETFYYGSMKSDTFVRVYRYNEPHPRSNLTRIEQVFRRRNAKMIASAIIEQRNDEIAATIIKKLNRHKINHEFTSNAKALLVNNDAKDNKTLAGTIRWLSVQVKPALEKLQAVGITKQELMGYLGLTEPPYGL